MDPLHRLRGDGVRSPSAPGSRELEASTRALYDAFSGYTLAPHVEGCPHCVSAADEAPLHSRPRSALSVDDLHRFAFKALSTWGGESDFKHFLPRLFELLPRGLAAEVAPQIVLGKLASADWHAWPPVERAAITRYLLALWSAVLSDERTAAALSADDLLSACAEIADDLTPYLDAWDADSTASATRQLADFVELHTGGLLAEGRIRGGFWRDPGRSQVSAWLCAPERSERLEAAFFAGEGDLLLLSRAVDCLAGARAASATP